MRLRHQLYYLAKPFLPWRLRIAMRRAAAKRALKFCGGTWPINPSADNPPPSWAGWPEGKRFALVLTHDVEGPIGLANCRRLAEAEMNLGFRSSFNLIPEGSYRVNSELRRWLQANDFEVGVHDLHHNGFLYSSAPSFRRKAARINDYLREWKASGFRSGFMFRNLEWLHQLNIDYDTSTFDTDPFEPQYEGSGTIFPFWVSRKETNQTSLGFSDQDSPRASRGRAGYWELPYTLPQDSTLFLVLEQTSNEIWRRKLAWLAESGGMALINVHPDYLDLAAQHKNGTSSVGDHYLDFLHHIRTRYMDSYWHCLPREMAAFFDGRRP